LDALAGGEIGDLLRRPNAAGFTDIDREDVAGLRADKRPRVKSEAKRHLESHFIPIFGQKILTSITDGEIGRQLATTAVAGSVLALTGELGSGKTQFVKGIVAGLGSGDPVTSPTFTIVHEYRGGRLPVYHFDFFRLEDRKAIALVGLDEYLFCGGVSIIEWADRFPSLVRGNAQWISLRLTSENERTITIEAGRIRDANITPNNFVRHESARA